MKLLFALTVIISGLTRDELITQYSSTFANPKIIKSRIENASIIAHFGVFLASYFITRQRIPQIDKVHALSKYDKAKIYIESEKYTLSRLISPSANPNSRQYDPLINKEYNKRLASRKAGIRLLYTVTPIGILFLSLYGIKYYLSKYSKNIKSILACRLLLEFAFTAFLGSFLALLTSSSCYETQ